ncbi:hypothetical protein LBMAG53_12060 [Planctomycetota bacterium]|nr:hypothetical protein LBMAG53_12060 [Planctomycetota bacterium]
MAPARRRRWPWILGGIAGFLLLLAVAAVWAAPHLAVWWLRPRLPLALPPHATLTGIAVDGVPPTAALRAALRPQDIRAAARWRGFWLPWGVVRPGQWLALDWHPGPELPPLSAVTVVVPAAQAPTVLIRLPASRLAEVISRYLPNTFGSQPRLTLEACTMTGGPVPGGRWRLHVEAQGRIDIPGSTIPVPALILDAEVRLLPGPGGLHPEVTVQRLQFSDRPDTRLSVSGTVAWATRLALPQALGVLTLPEWIPDDLHLDLQTTPTGAAF